MNIEFRYKNVPVIAIISVFLTKILIQKSFSFLIKLQDLKYLRGQFTSKFMKKISILNESMIIVNILTHHFIPKRRLYHEIF